jgi:hypothetical protein
MKLAAYVVAFILGIIAAVVVYPYFATYVIVLLAFLGAVAVGVLVAGILIYLANRYLPERV